MAVEADNLLCFDNMGFGPFAMCGSVFGIEDDFVFQGLQPLDEQRKDFYPLLGYSENEGSFSSSSSFYQNGPLSLEFVQSLSSELEKQRLEMDGLLLLEGQRLRSSILHDLKQQQAILLHKLESRINNLVVQKDEELAISRNRESQLQHLLKCSEMEAKAWEKKALEKEAIVFNLNNMLNQVREKEDDTMSFCDSSSSRTEEKKTEDYSEKRNCKLCQARKSCVVFLPCRHLCCCNSCEPLLGQCPLCLTAKGASLEVFMD